MRGLVSQLLRRRDVDLVYLQEELDLLARHLPDDADLVQRAQVVLAARGSQP